MLPSGLFQEKGEVGIQLFGKTWLQIFKQAQNKQLNWSHGESEIPRSSSPSLIWHPSDPKHLMILFLLACLCVALEFLLVAPEMDDV